MDHKVEKKTVIHEVKLRTRTSRDLWCSREELQPDCAGKGYGDKLGSVLVRLARVGRRVSGFDMVYDLQNYPSQQ
jgi:hypothetical protein